MQKFDNNSNKNNNNHVKDHIKGRDTTKKVNNPAEKMRTGHLKNKDILSVLFVGVGGQGIILSSTVLAGAAINSGFDVKVSEVHGMAQRGGSVEGSVRFGNKVYSPTIGKADFIIALEKLEALRFISRLKDDGMIIVNDYEIYPSTLYSKGSCYPEDIEARITRINKNNYFINAVKEAKALGEIRVANIMLLGVLSNFLPIDKLDWENSIKINLKPKTVDINIKAFNKGRNQK